MGLHCSEPLIPQEALRDHLHASIRVGYNGNANDGGRPRTYSALLSTHAQRAHGDLYDRQSPELRPIGRLVSSRSDIRPKPLTFLDAMPRCVLLACLCAAITFEGEVYELYDR